MLPSQTLLGNAEQQQPARLVRHPPTRRTAAKYAVLAEERTFEALLQWAEGVARSHGIVAPYLTPPALPLQPIPPPLLPVLPPPQNADVPMPSAPSTQPGKRAAPSELASAAPDPKQKRYLP